MYLKKNISNKIYTVIFKLFIRTSILITLTVIGILTGCISANQQLAILFPDKQLDYLRQTTLAIDYGYGYDTDVELGYIYSHNFSKINRGNKEKSFSDLVNGYEKGKLLQFYYSVYEVYSATKIKLEWYKSRKQWRQYTYLKNYLLPSLEKYYNLLEINVKRRLPDKETEINEKKAHIDEIIIAGLKEKEYGYWKIIP